MRTRLRLLLVALLLNTWAIAPAWFGPGGAVVAQAPTSRPALTVVSLNMARKNAFEEVAAAISHLLDRRKVDVFLLQEVHRDARDPQLIADELAEALDFHSLFQTTDYWDDGGSQGLAILSRYPLQDTTVIPLKHFDLGFRQRNRIGLAATVTTPLGQVRIINVHLDSRINANERLEQLAGALDAAAGLPGSSIIGGDFNTGDFKWLTRWFPIPFAARQQDAVRHAMKARGFDTPFASTGATFKHLGLKLDWIFSKGLQADAWGIDDIRFSDHRAIWSTMSAPAAPID